MDIKSLMIGDWVYNKHHRKNIRLTPYDFFTHTHNEFGEQGLAPFAKPTSGRDLEPIPLTPEILEKNGFKLYIPENHLETVYACQDISKAVADELYALWPYRDGSFYLLLRVDGKDMVRMNVHYAHELQHALRLCGIEKEIEL